GSIRISLSKPRSEIAIRTLRANGEAGDERKIIIDAPFLDHVPNSGAGFSGKIMLKNSRHYQCRIAWQTSGRGTRWRRHGCYVRYGRYGQQPYAEWGAIAALRRQSSRAARQVV